MSKYFSNGAALQAALQALPAYKTGSFTAFDPFFYGQTYMASYPGELSPIDHFVQIGAARGYKPNATFDPTFYQNSSADLAGLDGADLLYHFMMYGLDEGRVPNSTFANFDGTAYLAANPDVKAYVEANLAQFGGSLTNGAVAHYVKFGAAEGREASGVSSSSIFALTQGLDNIVGTSGNDTINAFAFNVVTGADTTTLQSVDVIDGGAGKDTLNIEVKVDKASTTPDDFNDAIQGTIKNVEIININNTAANSAAAVDATKLGAEATQIWQIGTAGAVTELAATTTAGFKDVAAAVSVTPADTAASAAVALDKLTDAGSVAFGATGTGILNAVTVSGTVVDGVDAGTTVDAIAVSVTVGKDVESLSVNTAVKSTLAVNDVASTKKVSTVDASASAGAISYNAASTVANVKTGAGDDAATNNFIFTSTVKAASLSTGAGKDTVNVLVDNKTNAINATVTVDAGDGDDTVVLNADRDATATLGVTLTAGAGNDKVTLSDGIDSVATTDVIDGGEGSDTVVIAGKTLDAEDYILLRDVVKNFEAIDFTTASASVDASRMAAYKAFSFADAAGTITKVAADQALTTTIGLTATAAGYVLDSDAVTAGNQTTYAGSLNITAKAGVSVTANAETVNLTVTPVTNNNGNVDNTKVTLEGDAKVANVTLNATTDTKNDTATTNDVLETSELFFNNTGANAALTTLTISGNGSATVTNADTKALVTVDASALNSVNIAGTAVTGLGYTSTNTKAETIKLGGGLDTVTLTGSTVLKSDTITGLSLVDNAAVAGTQVDAAKSDDLTLKSNDGTALSTFVKTTTTGATLDLALVELATSAAGNKLVFQFGGDTYVYADVTTAGAAGDNIVNDTDVLVKLTGTVDLDLLVSALG
jgi:trimeric autotransporter adhesin